MKCTWSILNEVLNRKKVSNNLPSSFKIDNQDISKSNPAEIANRFCNYFSNIGSNLAKKIPASSSSYKSFLVGSHMNSFFLESVSELELIEIAKSLRSGTAAGWDEIPMWAVKDTFNFISKPLTHIVNLSIQTGIVPDQMKIARVIPLFKSGVNNIFSNYRPVSVLPIFSKFLEKIVHNRLTDYINKHNILFDNQYGFRKNHSTALALLHLFDKLTSSIDQKSILLGFS
jgi:hypothetical protein